MCYYLENTWFWPKLFSKYLFSAFVFLSAYCVCMEAYCFWILIFRFAYTHIHPIQLHLCTYHLNDTPSHTFKNEIRNRARNPKHKNMNIENGGRKTNSHVFFFIALSLSYWFIMDTVPISLLQWNTFLFLGGWRRDRDNDTSIYH